MKVISLLYQTLCRMLDVNGGSFLEETSSGELGFFPVRVLYDLHYK